MLLCQEPGRLIKINKGEEEGSGQGGRWGDNGRVACAQGLWAASACRVQSEATGVFKLAGSPEPGSDWTASPRRAVKRQGTQGAEPHGGQRSARGAAQVLPGHREARNHCPGLKWRPSHASCSCPSRTALEEVEELYK